jgi:hypothetical protein
MKIVLSMQTKLDIKVTCVDVVMNNMRRNSIWTKFVLLVFELDGSVL